MSYGSCLSRKIVSNVFFNNELESELRELEWLDYMFKESTDRERAMQKVDEYRATRIYEHEGCSEECKRRGKFKLFPLNSRDNTTIVIGCGEVFSMDGNWKLTYPICMHREQKNVSGFGESLKYVDACPNQPLHGHDKCYEHHYDQTVKERKSSTKCSKFCFLMAMTFLSAELLKVKISRVIITQLLIVKVRL